MHLLLLESKNFHYLEKPKKKPQNNTKENIEEESLTSFNVQATVIAGRRAKDSING